MSLQALPPREIPPSWWRETNEVASSTAPGSLGRERAHGMNSLQTFQRLALQQRLSWGTTCSLRQGARTAISTSIKGVSTGSSSGGGGWTSKPTSRPVRHRRGPRQPSWSKTIKAVSPTTGGISARRQKVGESWARKCSPTLQPAASLIGDYLFVIV